jgi:thiol-disulfide isomerase/thioredoxin
MDLSGSFSLGPLTVPWRYVVMAVVFVAAVVIARVPLRRHPRLRRVVTDRLTNGAVIFVVGWKLAPAVLHPFDLFRDPLPLLMGAPGTAGVVVGAVAACAYLALVLVRPRRLRQASLLPIVLFVAVIAAGIGVATGAAEIAPLGPPGPPAPALALPTLGGGSASLASLRGRVVVVNFWATWCPPCRAELPALAAFARDQGAAGAVLLAVNTTSSEPSEDAVRAFVTRYGLEGDLPLDRTGDAARGWDVRAYPTTFIVDPEGRVQATRVGAVDAGWLRRETAAAARRRASSMQSQP